MKTSFRITRSLRDLENAILAKMDINRTIFHRRMIDYFVEMDGKVNPRLYITDRKNPGYIKMECIEQIYLDEERNEKIEELAEKHGVKKGKILFQALLDYCCALGPEVLKELEEYK